MNVLGVDGFRRDVVGEGVPFIKKRNNHYKGCHWSEKKFLLLKKETIIIIKVVIEVSKLKL